MVNALGNPRIAEEFYSNPYKKLSQKRLSILPSIDGVVLNDFYKGVSPEMESNSSNKNVRDVRIVKKENGLYEIIII